MAELTTVTLVINGEEHSLELDTRTSLLDLLREQLGLTGAKKGCDHGQCGASTVRPPLDFVSARCVFRVSGPDTAACYLDGSCVRFGEARECVHK